MSQVSWREYSFRGRRGIGEPNKKTGNTGRQEKSRKRADWGKRIFKISTGCREFSTLWKKVFHGVENTFVLAMLIRTGGWNAWTSLWWGIIM
jgi:hypothetical protein